MGTRVKKPKPSPDIWLETELQQEADLSKDFICLSAFSEHEGPIVLQEIPEKGNNGMIDLESYVLRIMSVDLNTQGNVNLFSKDTQSVVSEEGAQCYVHQCTLLDLRARGYARPLIFSYITKDTSKIMNHFESFLNEFTHISDLLKHGNQTSFLDDLEKELEELQQIIDAEPTPSDSHACSDQENDNEDNENVFENSDGRVQIGDIPQPFLSPEVVAMDDDVDAPFMSETNLDDTEEDIDSFVSANGATDEDMNEGNVDFHSEEDSKEYIEQFKRGVASLLDVVDDADADDENIEQLIREDDVYVTSDDASSLTMSGSATPMDSSTEGMVSDVILRKKYVGKSPLVTRRKTKQSNNNWMPDLISPDLETPTRRNKRKLQQSLQSIRQLMQQARNILAQDRLGFNKAIGDLISELSTSRDLKHELHITISKKRDFTSGLRSMETICGEAVYALAMQRIHLIHSHFSRHATLLHLERDDVLISVPASSLFSIGRTATINFNWECETSSKNFLALNSDYFLAPGGGNENNPSSVNEGEDTDVSVLLGVTGNDTEREGRGLSFSREVDSDADFSAYEEKEEEQRDSLNVGVTDTNMQGNATEYPSQSEDEELVEHIHSRLHTDAEKKSEFAIFRPTLFSSDEYDARRMYDPLQPLTIPTGTRFNSVHLECFASGLWSSCGLHPGHNLFILRSKYNFLNHLVYSLLTGRLLVIQAKSVNKEHVVGLIRALSIFVPDSWRKSLVVPWQSTPIRMLDLANSKLIGVAKELGEIHESVKRYISWMDFDNETLQAPYGDSKFIDNVLLPPMQRRIWPDEHSFLAHIHQELFYLSTKAYLYYRMCCIGYTKDTDRAFQSDSKTKDNQNAGQGGNAAAVHSANLEVCMNDQLLKTSNSYLDIKRRTENDPNIVLGVPEHIREESKAFFLQVARNIDQSDLPIIQYFVEVVKEQQAIETNATDPDSPIIRLDDAPNMKTFSNRFKKKQ